MKLKPKPTKLTINTFDLIKLRRHDIIVYIKKLHSSLKRKNEIIKLLKIKLKALYKIDENQQEKTSDKNNQDDEDVTAKTKEFIEEIKKTAIDIENSKRFVYEPTSGLYYDYATGYYYNAELALFYDGQSACYYSYDQEANEYKLHSQCASGEPDDELENKSKNDVDEEMPVVEKFQRKSNKSKHRKQHHNHHHRRRRRRRYSTSTYSSTYNSSSSSDSTDDSHYRRRHQQKKHKKKAKKSSRRGDSRRRSRRTRSRGRHEKEDGEISSSVGSSVILIDDDDETNKHPDDLVYHQDMAKIYPPSLRLVVTETNLTKLKVGQLFMVTYKGGSLGREGDHDVTIPDINVSKYHLKFTYNEDQLVYQIVDLGSRNGTFVDGNRISNAKQESEPYNLPHGCELQLSQTKLLCHIHDGHATCDQCEPGILAMANSETIEKSKIGVPIAESYKSELKRIQKKYGLEGEKFIESNPNKNVNDRAEKRRKEVGSTNPFEKTEVASVSSSIKSDNKGFKMLAKLGWSEGQSLGKNDAGIKEPIQVASNEGTSGLGSDLPAPMKLSMNSEKKNMLWKKTQERFKKLDKCDMFHESDQEDY